MWNQGLVNLVLMITKQGLKLMIIFQVWLGKMISKVAITKIKSSQREINKKKKTSKKSTFQGLSFIGSHCKIVGALGFSCITFSTYALKSSKSYSVLNLLKLDDFMFYFVLNPLKLDDFMFLTKTLCQMLSKLD